MQHSRLHSFCFFNSDRLNFRLNISFFFLYSKEMNRWLKWHLDSVLYFLPTLTHFIWWYHPPGSFTDPSAEGLSRERARERDRSRPHERRHHSSAGEKQRYYSCERYGSREQCHTKSAGPSRSTSPGEAQDAALLKQVRYLPFVAWWSTASMSSTPCSLYVFGQWHII